MFKQLRPMIVKEFRQIKRDKRVLAILTLVPALLLLLNGYALNFDVKHIPMAVYDAEKSKQSREFVNSFITSGYFDYQMVVDDYTKAKECIDEGKVKLVLAIPPTFSQEILSGRQATVQALVDGMDANSASTIIGYTQAVTLQYSQNIILQNLAKIGKKSFIPINYQPKIWYNPELKSAKFLVPGLIAFILAITG
ncbi:MAG: ABC transporter permease, partial [Bacteroidota bacterium]